MRSKSLVLAATAAAFLAITFHAAADDRNNPSQPGQVNQPSAQQPGQPQSIDHPIDASPLLSYDSARA